MSIDASNAPAATGARSERRARFEQAQAGGRVAVAQALNAARQAQGLSYRALETACGVRIATLQGWLTGKYVPQTGMRKEFARLAEAIDIADAPGTPHGVTTEEWWNALRGTLQADNSPRRMLARYATIWDDAGRPQDLLIAGESLGLLDQDHAEDLSDVEREFLAASRAAQTARLRAAELENARLKTSTRRFRAAAIVAAAFAVVAAVLGTAAGSTAAHLNIARATALGGEIASRAQVVADTMPGEAAQLAVAAHAIYDTPTTRSTLLSLTATPQPRRLLSAVGPGGVAATDELLVMGGTEHTIRLIDPVSGAVRHTIEARSSHTYALDIARADGRVLVAATGEDESGLPAESCVWDVTEEPSIVGCITVPSKSDSVALLPDGSGALFGGADGTIQRLALSGDRAVVLDAIPGPRADPTTEPGAVMGLAARGGTVVAVSGDGTVAVLSDPLGEAAWSAPLALSLPDSAVRAMSVTLSDDGARFAVPTSQNFTVELGRIDSGVPVWEASARGFESWVNDAVFLPDGGVAAVGSDQTLRFFTADGLLTRTQVLPSLPTAVALAGTALATYTVNGTTTIWPEGSFPAPSDRGRVFETTSDRAGEVIATVGSADGVLQAVRAAPGVAPTPLEVPSADVLTRYGVAVSPDGRFIATGGYGKLLVWRVGERSLSEPTVVDTLPDALITGIRYSPDGARIAVADQSADTVVIYVVREDPGAPGAGVTLEVETEIPVITGGAIRFLGDDLFVVHDGSWTLQVWNLESKELVGTADLNGGYPVSIVERPGHPTQLGYATESLEVGILDLEDPSNPRLLSRVTGLTDTPRDLAFSADGSALAVAAVSHVDVRDVSEDGLRISDSRLRLTGPMRTEITDAKFVAGDRLVASTYSGLLWWWDLDPARAGATVCSSIGDPLSLDEAQALAPSLPDDAELCGP